VRALRKYQAKKETRMDDPKGLGWDRNLDPVLYDLYAKKLPWKGWAGNKSPAERAYIKKVKASRRKGLGP
jgi:hypothetical protein